MKKLLLFAGLGIITSSAMAQTARVQAIHNSADAAADTVDVWLTTPMGSSKLLDDFAFRTASPFVTAPAGVQISLGIAPKNSTVVGDVIAGLSYNYNLASNGTYILVAEGLLSTIGYSPNTANEAFGIEVFAMGQESSTMMGNTDVLVHHGSTDAPTVDVDEAMAGNLVNNASYTDFAGYLALATADYTLLLKDSTGTNTLKTYSAPLATLNLGGEALVVVASGFLNPSVNSNGPAFGLYVALAAGGPLVALPEVFPTGLDEISKSNVSVYPNPAQDFLNVKGLELNNAQVQILDISGRIVNTSLFKVNNSTIDISSLSQGTYHLVLYNNSEKVDIVKFLKF